MIEPQFTTPEMDALWSGSARIARMAAFEAALAQAQAECGILPKDVAAAIERLALGAKLDAAQIFEDSKQADTPAIPFVKALTVAIAKDHAEAAKFVHYGSTSQDVIDTAAMLALNEAVTLIAAELAHAIDVLLNLAQTHADTPMAARTVLQQATPFTFGLKAALWAAGLARAREHLLELRNRDLAVQLGGAVGTLAIMGGQGCAVRTHMARILGLADPDLVWHTLRDGILRSATALVEVCGASAKIAHDIQLLMQTEVAEAAEESSDARGGSSAMPHKHNPVDSMVPIAAAQNAAALLSGIAQGMVVEHERAPGAWHGEWIALPLLTTLAHAAASAIRRTVTGLTIDRHAMAANLETLHGLLAAEALSACLAPALGKLEAAKLVRELTMRAVKEKNHLKTLACADATIGGALTPHQLENIFAHRDALNAAQTETHRLLALLRAQIDSEDR